MVGHRFLEMYGERAAAAGGGPFDVTVIGEEPRLAYDRVGLSGYFDGKTPDDLALARPGQYEAAGFAVRLATRARRIDRERRVVEVDGAEIPYDRLLLATGSAPFVPPVPGRDLPGCFVYRTIEDLEAISAWAGAHPGGVGAVIGGGLLGPRGGQRAAEAGPGDARRRARAAPDGAAARRRGRRRAARAASRSWASSCTPRRPAAEIAGADGRVRALRLRGRQRAGGRRGGVLGRHPPARRAGARRRPDAWASAAAS